MNYYAISDEKITAELGQRFRRLRQRRGYSKQNLADAMGLPLETITTLEKGKGELALFIAVMRQLGGFDQLDHFLIEARVKALELSTPRIPTEGTVMYRRRKSDFNIGMENDEPVENPKRKSDFSAADAATDESLGKTGGSNDLSRR